MAIRIGPSRNITLVDAAASEGNTGKATFETDASTVQRTYIMDIVDNSAGRALGVSHIEAIFYLLGGPRVAGSGSLQYIDRVLPHAINYYQSYGDNKNYLYATKCDFRPISPANYTTNGPDGDSIPQYQKAFLDVTYETLPYDIKGNGEINYAIGVPDESWWQRYITKIAKPAGQYFSLPTSRTSGTPPVTVYSYKYVTGGTPDLQEALGKLLSNCNLQVTWHSVPEAAVPSMFVNPTLTAPGAIDKYVGKTNHNTFNFYPQGTLLLLGVQMTPHRSAFGNRVFDVVYMFKYFEPVPGAGHLFNFRPLSGGWLEVTTDGVTNLVAQTAGKSIYDFGNFGNLFRPPPGNAPLF